MDKQQDNIIVNSCEYTPVYLIPNPSVTQAGSYIVSQRSHDVSKPAIDNLKSFYENSGNMENGILSSPKKPRILRKHSPSVIGNNLKLASFLLPKIEIPVIKKEIKKEYLPIPVSKPAPHVVPTVPHVVTTVPHMVTTVPHAVTTVPHMVTTVPHAVTTVPHVVTTVPHMVTTVPHVVTTVSHVVTVPRVEVDRKIVRVGTIPFKRTTYNRSVPKNKPREIITPAITNHLNLSKHTSVQLLKLGETYHSLNQLSDEQMKIVKKALNLFSDPENIPKEPAYDPVTNTKFIYKVVSPRDLTVVGKNNVEVKPKKQKLTKKVEKQQENEQDRPPGVIATEPTVTRSGRMVKMPKQMVEETPMKPRKKNGNVINCFQCSSEFCSLYRLQRHYEVYPTHIPAKIHSNLFHCLLAIMESGSEDDQAGIFVQQLEQLVDKLKGLLPCLLKRIDGREGRPCTINDDIGRLFGMNSGKYSLNMDALSCVKDKDGHCAHNPAPKNNQFSADMSKPSQLWLSKHNEELANNEAETEDCARINSVDKWPTATKRIWKIKHQRSQKASVKRMRLASESSEQFIELGTEDVVAFSKPEEESAINVVKNIPLIDNNNDGKDISEQSIENSSTSTDNQIKKSESAHMQFYSAHFDIRSSPIKPSALVRKFQIDPQKIPSYEVQIMQPLALDKPNETANDIIASDSDNLQLFRDNEIAKATIMNNDLNYSNAKEWSISTVSSDEQSNDSFMKSNILFESGLTPIKENNLIEPSLIHTKNKPVLFDSSSKPNNIVEPIMQSISNNGIEPSLLISKDKSNDYYVPSSRSDSLIGPTLLNTRPSSLSEPTLLNSRETSNVFFLTTSRSDGLLAPALLQTKSSSMVEPSLLTTKDESNGFYEPSSRPHSLIEPTLAQNKLLEASLLRLKDKSNGLFEPSPICVKPKSKPSLLESSFNYIKDKSNSLFDTALSNVKDRSNNLFEQTSIHIDKNSLNGPSLVHAKEDNTFFKTVTHRKHDVLFEPTSMSSKSDLIEPTLLHEHKTLHLDESHSNQGQSVLNFLESLGNELAYPETEIRNSSVDFQLDLFSFNSS